MNAVRSEQGTTIYERTPQIFHRRRSLFPPESSDSESDSDLGHMSPISFDSCFGPEDLKCCILKQRSRDKYSGSTSDTIGDYDILGVVDIGQYDTCTPASEKLPASETMSPLYLSPHMSRIKEDSDNVVNETPSKISPSCKLKTPHDTSNTNTKLPKLVRKSLLDSSELPSNKRKLSPYNSPKQTKHIKLDPKNSKVRTTLFPEVNVSLSTKQFYPESEDIMTKIMNKRETRPKSSVHFSTSRKAKSRSKIGQINAGVRHKIRKPKQKKASRTTLAKAAVNAIGNTSLNDYIMDLKEMRSKTKTVPMIENKENAKPVVIQEKQVIPSTAEPHEKMVPSTVVIQQNLITPAIMTKTLPAETESKKRSMSCETEPDVNKKFFKFSRSKGVVKMNKNIKLEVDHGKVTLLDKKKESKNDFDMSDLVSDEHDLPKTDIESVISSLEDEVSSDQESSNKITLQAHSSVVASENSILLHHQPRCPASVILSPISQMCDDTSGLALSSPKMAKNLTSVLNRMPNATQNVFNKMIPQKNNGLFPIFCGNSNGIPEKRLNKGSTCTDKKFRKLSSTQMLLDAGQKRFGVTQCPECDIVYHMGDPSDEIMHLHYHNSGHILRFQGWKNERIVADFHTNGRIIQIVPTDSKSWWKKANDLMNLINQELGCYNMEFSLDNCQIFMYIKNKSIVGCIVAIAKDEGHQMLSTGATEVDLCSENKYPIKCGIPRIWVAHNHRKQGIATALMNALKNNFIKGYALKNTDIAFSPPTEMGKKFAISYCKTPNFFIYYV